MLNLEPVTLEGYGVRLEPLNTVHCQGLFQIGQEAEDWLYMPRPCLQSLQDTRQWIEQAHHLLETGNHVSFAIIDTKSGEVAGSSRYLSIRPEHRSLEIGYSWIGKKFQRSHVNTAAKLCLLSHAFETLNTIRVEFKTDGRNQRSQNAIKRLGAIEEGTFRKHMIVQNGFIRDSVYFSIIDHEWPEIKKQLENKL